jgi:hypothetical protein
MGTENSEKPLDKMTVKELREVGKEIPEITGVHGKNKAELLMAIKKAQGIKEEPKEEPKVKPKVKSKVKSKVKPKQIDRSIGSLKKTIKIFRKKQAEAVNADDKMMAAIYRRKISRLKKKTRRAA